MFVMGTISQWKVFIFFSINQSAGGKLELSSNQILSGLVACVYIDISYELFVKHLNTWSTIRKFKRLFIWFTVFNIDITCYLCVRCSCLSHIFIFISFLSALSLLRLQHFVYRICRPIFWLKVIWSKQVTVTRDIYNIYMSLPSLHTLILYHFI